MEHTLNKSIHFLNKLIKVINEIATSKDKKLTQQSRLI